MATVTTKFQCSVCNIGFTKLVVKSSKNGSISIGTKSCVNKKCNASFGIKEIINLKRLPCQ